MLYAPKCHKSLAYFAFLSLCWYIQLCDAVQSLPPKVHYPINLDPSSVKGKFVFHPPLTVKVVGSYLLKTAIKPDLNIDLALQIPPVREPIAHFRALRGRKSRPLA